MIKKYRTKSTVVDAAQYDGSNEAKADVAALSNGGFRYGRIGDWLVRKPNRTTLIYTTEDFLDEYEPIDEPITPMLPPKVRAVIDAAVELEQAQHGPSPRSALNALCLAVKKMQEAGK